MQFAISEALQDGVLHAPILLAFAIVVAIGGVVIVGITVVVAVDVVVAVVVAVALLLFCCFYCVEPMHLFCWPASVATLNCLLKSIHYLLHATAKTQFCFRFQVPANSGMCSDIQLSAKGSSCKLHVFCLFACFVCLFVFVVLFFVRFSLSSFVHLFICTVCLFAELVGLLMIVCLSVNLFVCLLVCLHVCSFGRLLAGLFECIYCLFSISPPTHLLVSTFRTRFSLARISCFILNGFV